MMSKVSILKRDEIFELFGLIEESPFKPYFQYPRFDCSNLSEAFFKNLQAIAADPNSHIIALKEEDHPVAFCVARKSGIESEIFHKKIYAIPYLISAGSYKDSMSNKQKLLRFFSRYYMSGIGMVSCRANSEDLSTIHALEKERYRYMDTLVTYAIDLKQPRPKYQSIPYRIRPVQKSEVTTLKKIVRDSHFMDRFHNDPHIPRKESDRLYETFIENAVKGKGADAVFIAECESKVVGFNTIEIQNRLYSPFGIKIGSFVLNAVAPEFRSQGIYSNLMHESLQYLQDRADLAEIRTHAGNAPVHRALPRLGFRLSLSQLTFHAWNTNIMPLAGTEMRNE